MLGRGVRIGALVAVALLVGFADARPSFGDEAVDACSAAAVSGQRLRREGQLRAATIQFELCAKSSCRPDIVRDCTGWLEEATNATPSIVVAIHDEHGLDVVDPVVQLDGQPIAPEAVARAVPLDPGLHTLTASRPGSMAVRETIVLREGERMRPVSVVLPPARAIAPAVVEMPRARPVPAAAYGLGAVGLAGLAAFAIAGSIGDADWNRSDCSSGCLRSDAVRVRRELVTADISLGVGVVASAIATLLYLRRPSLSSSGATPSQARVARGLSAFGLRAGYDP
jgi:hypothetical protein